MDKEQKLLEKKRLIISAFRRCLEKNVYSNISIQSVADEAGLSKGGLLHYFAAKEDMFLELAEELCSDIQRGQSQVVEGITSSVDQASLSSLYVVEQFFLDQNNIHVLLNLLLLSFEDEGVRGVFTRFFQGNLVYFQKIIEEKNERIPPRRKADLPPHDLARIAQVLVLAAGIIEMVHPVDFDPNQLTKYLISMLKG